MIFFIKMFVLLIVKFTSGYNDFPSLITANASMAVIIEKDFFEHTTDYRHTLSKITETIGKVVRSKMKIGGIDFTVFVDSSVNLERADYTILLSVAACQTTWRLNKIANKEKLVHLAVTDPDCPRISDNNGIGLPLIVPGEELPQIFFDLRVSGALSWPKVNFIHDDTFARDTISRVVKALSAELPDERLVLSTRALFSTNYEKNENAMRQRIKKILNDFHVDQLGNCFMVIVTVDMVASILEVAKSLKMLHPSSQWLFVISESSGSETNLTSWLDFFDEGENVAFVRNATDYRPDCHMGLLCHVSEFIGALSKSLETSLMNELDLYDRLTEEEFEIIRLTKAERKNEIIKGVNRELASLRSTSVNFGCGGCLNWQLVSAIVWGTSFVTTTAETSSSEKSDTTKNPAGPWFQRTGDWYPGPGVRMTEPIFPHVDHGFRNINLPVVTFHNPPWQIIKRTNQGTFEYDGLVFEILRHLSAKLNFTYTVRMPRTTTTMAHDPINDDTSKDASSVAAISVAQQVPPEIIDLVRSRNVFLAAVALTVTEQNHRGINFTDTIAEENYAMLSAKPKPLSRALLFIAPFTGGTWIWLSSMIFVIGPVLYLIIRYSPRPVDPHDKIGLSSLWSCSWYVYGALLQQGGMNLPKADSARLIVGTWWIVVMVIVATYSGNLIAFLTFPRIDAPIDEIDDLLARSYEFAWSFPNGSALEGYLTAVANEDDKYKRLLTGAGRLDPTKPNEIIKRVKNDNHVLIDWKISLAFLMSTDLNETDSCNFHLGTEEFMPENLAMIISGNSPYLPLVNSAIKRMRESGLIKKWTSDKVPMRDKCWESMNAMQEATNHKVNMGDMQGIFFVLAIGFTMALVAIITEYFWHMRKKSAAKKLIRPFVS